MQTQLHWAKILNDRNGEMAQQIPKILHMHMYTCTHTHTQLHPHDAWARRYINMLKHK